GVFVGRARFGPEFRAGGRGSVSLLYPVALLDRFPFADQAREVVKYRCAFAAVMWLVLTRYGNCRQENPSQHLRLNREFRHKASPRIMQTAVSCGGLLRVSKSFRRRETSPPASERSPVSFH